MTTPISVSFERPECLWLLLTVPIWWLMIRHSLAGLGLGRLIAAVMVRTLVACVLIAVLAEAKIVRHTDDQAVIVVIDESKSIPQRELDDGWTFIHDAARSLRPAKDEIGVVRFNGNAIIDQMPTEGLRTERAASATIPGFTNIERAIQLATAMFPADRAKRILLVSDGNENIGDAIEGARKLAALGVVADVLPLIYRRVSDALFEKMTAPGRVAIDEPCELSLVIRSEEPQSGRLRLFENGEPYLVGGASATRIDLRPGLNRFSLEVVFCRRGVHRLRAVFEPDSREHDTVLENNAAETFVQVPGRESLLIVFDDFSADPVAAFRSAERLGEAYSNQGGEVDVAPISDVSFDASVLDQYPTIVLSNVAVSSLTQDAQQTLLSYVRDIGGGVVAVGGDQSFSVGGYQNTLLEELLPVQTPRDRESFSSIGVVLVIDRSGSMAGEKIDQAKKAAIRVSRMLCEYDMIGVVGFDSVATWVRPFASAGAHSEIARAIEHIGSGGGTNLFPAMEIGAGALFDGKTDVRHMIVLSDGQSTPGDFQRLSSDLGQVGISVSTIAVGQDADQRLLKEIADRSGGRYYLVDRALKLPQVFTREVALVGRRGMHEGEFTPTWHAAIDSPLSFEQRESEPPRLYGHVIVEAKPGADVSMVREHDKRLDPILAHWQFGLGKSTAFASGGWSDWGRDWSSWRGFSSFWTRVFRWSARSVESDASLAIRVEQDGDEGKVIIDTTSGEADVASLSSISANVLTPSGTLKPVPLQQTSVGTFEGSFPAMEEGTYLVQAHSHRSDGMIQQHGRATAGFSIAYSPEFRDSSSNEHLLQQLADETSGRVLDKAHPDLLFDPSRIRSIDVSRSIGDLLLYVAIGMFLVDVFVRRVRWEPTVVLSKLAEGVRSRAQVRTPDSSSSMTALRHAREKVRHESALRDAGTNSQGSVNSREPEIAAPTVAAGSGQLDPGPTSQLASATQSGDAVETIDAENGMERSTARLIKLRKNRTDGDGRR